MGIDELLRVNADGYTREECKLFDAGFKVHFSEDTDYKEEREDVIEWYKKNLGLSLIIELETINQRIAMIFN
ncbi:MAG: hypothetical protein RSC38_05240 [Oscillospiraceae bacterium]